MSYTNKAKSTTVTAVKVSQNSSTPSNMVKAGQPPPYDSNITYDGLDPYGRPVYYDSLGTAPSFTNKSKS